MSNDSIVAAPNSLNINPGTTDQPFIQGRQGEQLVSEIKGKWATQNLNRVLFSALVTAVTVPVVASGLVSVFTLWNPPNSGVIGEIVEASIGQVLATTVVDTIGWYASPANLTALGTFTTKGTPLTNIFSGRVMDTPQNGIQFYSAFTHSGTPVRVDIIGSFGAVTDAPGIAHSEKIYDGRLLLPPGIAMSIAMSTAAGTASGLDLQAVWVEHPFAG